MRAVLEEAVHGYDVVPAAIHLTAATLAMAEMRQIVANMPLYWMPHDVRNGKARLGSLDFLQSSPGKGQAQYLAMFPDESRDPGRVTGAGERVFDAYMPADCDLVIANPPYTRAGGPGTQENSEWNPIFGSVLSSADGRLMQSVLRRTLDATPASLYAGLGSAFTVLAKERVKVGGRMAIVLPATALTGSRWARSAGCCWTISSASSGVVVSHDARNRTKRGHSPRTTVCRVLRVHPASRRALIVATRIVRGQTPTKSCTRFVNLRRNPDEAIDAMAISRSSSRKPRRIAPSPDGRRSWWEMCSGAKSFVRSRRFSTTVRGSRRRSARGGWLTLQRHWRERAPCGSETNRSRFRSRTCRSPVSSGPTKCRSRIRLRDSSELSRQAIRHEAGHPAFWHHKWDGGHNDGRGR